MGLCCVNNSTENVKRLSLMEFILPEKFHSVMSLPQSCLKIRFFLLVNGVMYLSRFSNKKLVPVNY